MENNAQPTEQKRDAAHPVSVQQGPKGRQEYSQQMRNSLAARLQAGDRQAAEELVDAYYQQLYIFMRRLGHSQQVSEDLTQESFLQAWRHIAQLRDGKALNSWLYRIAANVSRLYWRKHAGSEPATLDGMDVADDSEPQWEKLGRAEQIGRLKNVVARLPVKLKQAVVLHYMQHLTIAEAAEAAAIREGTFKSRLNRALKTLRKHIT